VTAIRDFIFCQSEANDWLILPVVVVWFLLFPIFAFTVAFIYTIIDLLGESISFPADATSVPTFYVPRHRYPKLFHASLLIVLGSIFGGIHCAGWNFPFPTYTEHKLWRVASLAVTTIPIGLSLVSILVFKLLVSLGIRSSNADEVLGVTLTVFMLAYLEAFAPKCIRGRRLDQVLPPHLIIIQCRHSWPLPHRFL